MAHGKEKRLQLRTHYVHKRLSLEAACAALHIPRGTGTRWKREARDKGDDWEKARTAVAMGDQPMEQMARALLEDYLLQHQSVMDRLKEDHALGPAAKLTPQNHVAALASLSDSLTKTMNSLKRVAPELNRYAVALDTMQRFATWMQERAPERVPLLIELLEPFGAELARAYA